MKHHLNQKYVDLIPKLSKDEYVQLESNIIKNGCLDKIKVNNSNTILDGHNRWKICIANKLDFDVEVLNVGDETDEKIWIINNQFGRRNIGSFTRTELALQMEELISSKSNQGKRTDMEPFDNVVKKLNTREEVAKVAKVSQGNVAKVKKIKATIKDEKTLSDLRDNKKTINQVYKDIRKSEIQQERKVISDAGAKISNSDKWNVYKDDISTWKSTKKYDFIITDPPYPKEFLNCFSILSKRAKELLKPNGLLIVMSGQSYLDEVMKRLSENMTYYWNGAYMLPGQPTPLRQKQVNTSWKPIIFYSIDGNYNGKIFGDTFISDANDKDFHKWGQSVSGMYSLISKICLPGQSILDPFCGASTTGIAALKYGCFYDGIDLLEDNVNISKRRLYDCK